MIEEYECLRQPPGSNSCLPTVVRAIVLFLGYSITQEDASEYCGETEDGCFWPEALDGLRREGYSVVELSSEEEIVEKISDGIPVVVTIVPDNRLRGTGLNHAVVILEINTDIAYHDPASGTLRHMNTHEFWQAWNLAGGNAATLEP